MFKLGAKLTNVRPVANDEGTISTTPTKGQIRLSPKASQKIGVNAGDYLAFRDASDENGNPVPVCYKGKEGDGMKLASTSESGAGTLNGSAGNLWAELGGNTNNSNVFKVGDAFEIEGVTYFPLSHSGEKAKTPRNKKAATA